MDEFAALARPAQSPVKVDPNPKQPEADGFSYPTFRLLNKQARTILSEPINPQSSISYRLFTVANSRGWFAAATFSGSSYDIIVSTLEDLRTAFGAAKDGNEDRFMPKRSIFLSDGKPNILTFASNDSCLLVGLEDGSILVYDTVQLFSSGSEDISPTHVSLSSSGALRQIVPNPGTEPGLSDLVAIVRDDGTVQLVNTQLESQGGWTSGGNNDLRPVAASWSPKGKHLAIGLQAGDILTFAPANNAVPNKYIPRTADGVLVSLDWIGPGHTFRTSYTPRPPNVSDPCHHVITLDTKSSTAIYVALNFPFTISDRPQQSFIMGLPKWDEDSATAGEDKALIVVGDTSSVDLEVIAHSGNQWYQENQENQLTLPLDKDMNDTMLLSLEADLTDTGSGAPVMYAYLNDGTIQGWHVEHSKPYVGLITPNISVPQIVQPSQNDLAMSVTTIEPTSSPFSQPSPPATSAFGQPSAFGQTGFGQKPAVAFGGPSNFGANSASGGGFSAFASTGTSTFGGAGTTNSSAFGKPSEPSTGSAFGGGLSQQSTTSPFGGGATNASGSSGGNVFGSSGSMGNAFSAFGGSGSGNVFGQPSFGFATPSVSSTTSSNDNLATAPTFTREASMQDSAPTLGGLSLGGGHESDAKPTNNGGIFGSFASSAPAKTESTSAFGSLVKPATGFGALNNFQTRSSTTNDTVAKSGPSSAFGSIVKPATGFGALGNLQTSSASTNTTNAQPESQSTFSTSNFGKPGFGQTSFGQAGFGGSSFGQSGFGKATPSTNAFSGGGFSAFANKPASLVVTAQQELSASKPALSSASTGGFASFVSNTPASFSGNVKEASSTPLQEPRNTPSFGSSGPSNAISSPSFDSSAFSGTPGTTTPIKSPFVLRETTTPAVTPKKPSGITSPSSSPEPSPVLKSTTPLSSPTPASTFKSSSPGPTTGAFANLQSSPSAFKPASGFGAFGSDQLSTSSSPFFKKAEPSTSSVPVFASAQPSSFPSSTTPSSSPAFGAPSLIGRGKPSFPSTTPTKPTPSTTSQTSAFSSFNGSSSGFAAFSGPKKSFTELLRTEVDSGDPTKPSSTGAAENMTKNSGPIFGTTPVLAFDSQTQKDDNQEDSSSNKTGIKKDTSVDTISEEPVNISSASSSFVEVDANDAREVEEGEVEEADESSEPEDGEEDDDSSFLSDSVKSHESSDLSSEDGSDSEDDNEEELSVSPPVVQAMKTPLPLSRSPSSTPQPETPRIEVTPSPSPLDEESPSSKVSESNKTPGRESSTTPPGTPTKEVTSVFSKPSIPSPPAPASPPATPPFGLGPGRHSNRPTKSSPLASAPVSGDDEDEEEEGSDEAEKTAKIEPVPLIKTPVSPKVLFSVKTEAPVKSESSEVSPTSRRPKTPPLLSSGDKAPPMPCTPVLTHAIPPGQVAKPPAPIPVAPPLSDYGSPKTTAATSNFFGKPLSSTASTKAEPPRPASTPLNSLFGTPTLPTAPSSVPPTNAFGGPGFTGKGLASPSPSTSGSSSSIFSGSAFSLSLQQPGGVQAQSVFGKLPSLFPSKSTASLAIQPSGTTSFFSTPPSVPNIPTPAAPPPIPEMTMEEGMQKECALLITHLNKELDDLKNLAQEAAKKRGELSKTVGGLPKKADLGDALKWTLSNISQFGQVLRLYEKDLPDLREQREHSKQAIRDLQAGMLKAITRNEEIERFDKAKNDAEFAKMLRSRTLGPEHLESQSQLRRNIRNMREGIQKLECNLRASKKRLTQFSTGKPALRPPSLDTINRTYRNIDIAIQQQSDAVSNLASRVAELDIGSPRTPNKTARDARLPDIASRRPFNVTPNVATTTAAALNAERSAHNLKRALLSIRSEPLLNKQAATAPPAPVVFNTPQKAEGSAMSFGFKTPITGPLFSAPAQNVPVTPPPNWSLPDDDFSPTVYTPTQRRSIGGGQKKHGSVALKRSPGMSPTPAPPTFDWGPLPKFDNTPRSSLPASVKIGLGKNGPEGKSN